jgi:hypothetical protein
LALQGLHALDRRVEVPLKKSFKNFHECGFAAFIKITSAAVSQSEGGHCRLSTSELALPTRSAARFTRYSTDFHQLLTNDRLVWPVTRNDCERKKPLVMLLCLV